MSSFHIYSTFRITENNRGVVIVKQIEDFIARLQKFNKNIFEEWVDSVPQQIEKSLKQCLLKRNENMELIVNFNPQVSVL